VKTLFKPFIPPSSLKPSILTNASSILGTPSTVPDPLWYPDTGATHHITPDSSVFSKKNMYNGNDNVQLGNGSGMKISDVGSAFLSSPHSSQTFTLHNLLHVSSINKHLISVSQFAWDNGVFFEFYPNHCFVKHQVTKEIILQGKICDGLYVFPNLHHVVSCATNTCSLNNIVNHYDLWHKRLGHASSQIVHHVMRTNNVPFNKNVSFCDSCVQAKFHQLPFSSSHTTYTTLLQLFFVDI